MFLESSALLCPRSPNPSFETVVTMDAQTSVEAISLFKHRVEDYLVRSFIAD